LIEGAKIHLVDTIEVTRPYKMISDPNTNLVYVTSDATDSVYIIDAKTKDLLNTLSITKPCGIAINRGTNTIYVTSEEADLVNVVNGSSQEVITSINVGKGPRGIDIDPHNNKIYVANTAAKSI